jgi:prolyl-tRNA editing enzyme YbaK/EbsC (Cys-tRNA(Pro) deacylase)
MGTFTLGTLSSVPANLRPDLLAASTRAELEATGLLGSVGVVEIDPSVSDTAATQQEFGLHGDMLANCVVVGGKREGTERLAACVVLATTRADVNGAVRRYLDVRKASFLPMERAVELTGMEYGGITPIGLPRGWPVLVDARVAGPSVVVIGSGVRRSKILLPGILLAKLPSAQVVDGLGQ